MLLLIYVLTRWVLTAAHCYQPFQDFYDGEKECAKQTLEKGEFKETVRTFINIIISIFHIVTLLRDIYWERGGG